MFQKTCCTISGSIINRHEISPIITISKRYRKNKTQKKFWKYMWVGQYPYGKSPDDTEEDRLEKEERILQNRRTRGRNLMDWLYMPHLQYILPSNQSKLGTSAH